jgi:hypothetical protein
MYGSTVPRPLGRQTCAEQLAMPIKHAIWKVGQSPAPLAPSALATEQLLEDMIVAEPKMLSAEWMLIGRQEHTGYGGRIDLLAIAPDASLVLVELKRDRTPREIVAQALDYASWVESLEPDQIAQIYRRHSGGRDLGSAFARFVGLRGSARQNFGLEGGHDREGKSIRAGSLSDAPLLRACPLTDPEASREPRRQPRSRCASETKSRLAAPAGSRGTRERDPLAPDLGCCSAR